MLSAENTFKEAVQFHRAAAYEQAIDAYQRCLSISPNHPAPHFNLGTLYSELTRWHEAISHFSKALSLSPDSPDILYNLSIAYVHLQELLPAIQTLDQLVLQEPSHAAAQHLLACLLTEKKEIASASTHYELALSHETQLPVSEQAQIRFNFAVVLMNTPSPVRALQYLREACVLQPDYVDAYYNRGIIADELGLVEEAVGAYERVIELNPYYFAAFYRLILLMHYQKDERLKPQIIAYCQQALALEQNTTLAILLKTYMEQSLSHLPIDFIASLYDHYAPHFESHLQKHLGYQVPHCLLELMQEVGQGDDRWTLRQMHMLDAGCGTGLVGQIFKSHVKSMVGLDCSQQMLEKARQKEIYASLVHAEIVDYLSMRHANYDLIVAGDVLMYFSSLQAFFCAASQALISRGYLLISIESIVLVEQLKEFQWSNNLRFQHDHDYVLRVASEYGFDCVGKRSIVLRQQHYQDVEGLILLFQATSNKAL